MTSTGRWLVDLQSESLTVDDKQLLFCNPLNPGGTVYQRQELEDVLAYVDKHDLIICSDEIHCDLLLEPGVHHIPFASLNERAAQRSITLMSPSKTFNLAGLGASMAIIPNEEIRRKFQKERGDVVPGVNVLAYAAAEAAYQHGNSWLIHQVEYLKANRNLLISAVAELPELNLNKIEATYLAWIDISELVLTDSCKYFESFGIGLTSGLEFGDADFVRLNFACPRSTLVKALQRFTCAVKAKTKTG
ncbi:aminotransferase class I/II-fold pyridoxal phosphate-dependent enzyme [Psychromonas ossibalaenae]|uniref:aminotransferase class I/II-fold pyridoxal phosphate-dependent enzyme n=1 Tax=Psychromonas ossibalaenae TaxID=444922 RepID=UPI00035CF522|nr:aminotransferase class I/II-fold pyridoxal phosphate-dependent enzyme [Psychromonas ossibalaenae]